MARVARLSVDIQADSASLTTALARADRAMQSSGVRWNRTLSQLDRSFRGLTSRVQGATAAMLSLHGGIGTLLGGAGIVALTRSALNAADGIGKMADRLGLSTTAVQGYQYAAGLAGVSTDQFEGAIRKLNQQIGSGTLRYRDTESALAGIADRIQAATSGTERARIATEAFGRAGIQLIPMLQGGAAGLRATREEAERLGLVLDERTIRQAEALNDELSRMMQVAQRNFQQGLLGGLVRDSEGLRSVYADPAFQQGLRAFGSFVGETLGFVVRNADTIIRTLRALAAVYVGFKVGGAVAGRRGAIVGGAMGAGVAGIVELMSGAADDVELSVGRINQAIDQAGQAGTSGTTERSPLDRLREQIGKLTEDVAIAESQFSPALERVARAVQQAGLSIFTDFPADGPVAQAINQLIELYGRLEAATARTATATEENTERQATALKRLSEDGENVFSALDRAGARALKSIEDAILETARTGKLEFKKLVDSILSDIARLVIRKTITGPIASALGDALVAGFRADGGPVTGGQSYVVGERGPEMFVPNSSGTIIPNEALGGGGGVMITQNFAVDARGADSGVIPRLRAEMIAIARASQSDLLDAIQRGGSTARIVGRRA
jgi:hypothetical protein